MEEVKQSQVSFMLDTDMPGDYVADFRGQHVIIHTLRLGKDANLTLRGMHIRFRQLPKVKGSLKIIAGGDVFFPSDKTKSNIEIKSVGSRKVWNTNDTQYGLNELDDLQPPKKIKTEQHNVANVSFRTDFDHNISLELPRCSLMVNEIETTNENATVNFAAGNIWFIGDLNARGVFSATDTWTVKEGVKLGESLKLVSSNRFWPSEEKVQLHSPLQSSVLNGFHLESWK